MTLILTTNDPVKSRMPTMSATGAVLRYRDDTFMRSSASSFPQVHVQGDRSFSDEKATFEDMLPMLLRGSLASMSRCSEGMSSIMDHREGTSCSGSSPASPRGLSTSASLARSGSFDRSARFARDAMLAYRDPFGNGLPGPYLEIRLSWNGRHREILGLLDTGVDQTQIPEITAQALQLEQIDVAPITSAHGDERDKPIYVVDLELEGMSFPRISVVGDDYPIVLIGRDVLNEMTALFEGSLRQFVIARP